MTEAWPLSPFRMRRLSVQEQPALYRDDYVG